VQDTSKARILDETQSNPYAGQAGDDARVQYTTREYLESLLEPEQSEPPQSNVAPAAVRNSA
jgi:hypothetical protein